MNVLFEPNVKKFVSKLSQSERSKVFEYIELFIEYKFALETKYLKKVLPKLWELRPGRNRLFFTVVNPDLIIIYAMKKKSQRITKQTLLILKQKMREYL